MITINGEYSDGTYAWFSAPALASVRSSTSLFSEDYVLCLVLIKWYFQFSKQHCKGLQRWLQKVFSIQRKTHNKNWMQQTLENAYFNVFYGFVGIRGWA